MKPSLESEITAHKDYGILQTKGGYCYWVQERYLRSTFSQYYDHISKSLAEELGLKSTGRQNYLQPSNGTVLYKNIEEVKEALECVEKEEEMNKLYEVTLGDMKKYATKLAVNSNGDWVMEEKGTGAVFTARPDACEEVKPYTIEVSTTNGSKVHHTAEKDKFKVGEMFWTSNSGIMVVTKIDTKQDRHQGDFKPVSRLLTEKV